MTRLPLPKATCGCPLLIPRLTLGDVGFLGWSIQPVPSLATETCNNNDLHLLCPRDNAAYDPQPVVLLAPVKNQYGVFEALHIRSV